MSEVVAVVGLGYVGLPLAVEFGKKFDTIGFDLSAAKIDSYRRFCDPTGEISSEDLRAATRLTPTSDPSDLRRADFIVIERRQEPASSGVSRFHLERAIGLARMTDDLVRDQRVDDQTYIDIDTLDC